MKLYEINFKHIEVYYHEEYIEANSLEEARAIAKKLLSTEQFEYDLMDRADYDDHEDSFIEAFEVSRDAGVFERHATMSRDTIAEYLENELNRLTVSDNFYHLSVGKFNELFANGNPIVATSGEPMYCMGTEFGMVTIVKLDGEWTCEVTDGDSTGIAQSGFHATPEDAWADTRQQLINSIRTE